MKQIALGAHNYESANGNFPPGYLGPLPNAIYDPNNTGNGYSSGQWVGSLVFLMPYMELNNIYTSFSSSVLDINSTGGGVAWYSDGNAFTAAQTKISNFLCPADGVRAQYTPAFLTQYQPSGWTGAGGLSLFYWTTDYGIGQSNYTGVMGAMGPGATTYSYSDGPGVDLSPYTGIFYNRSRTRITDITDGSSNTLMFGEGVGSPNVGSTTKSFMWTWVAVGAMPTKFGIQSNPANSNYNMFSSNHIGGIVNFAFGDASVRTIRPAGTANRNPAVADWYAFQALSGMADGQVNSSSITN